MQNPVGFAWFILTALSILSVLSVYRGRVDDIAIRRQLRVVEVESSKFRERFADEVQTEVRRTGEGRVDQFRRQRRSVGGRGDSTEHRERVG